MVIVATSSEGRSSVSVLLSSVAVSPSPAKDHLARVPLDAKVAAKTPVAVVGVRQILLLQSPPLFTSMSLHEVWQAAASSPFQPTVGKESQLYIGLILLFIGKDCGGQIVFMARD